MVKVSSTLNLYVFYSATILGTGLTNLLYPEHPRACFYAAALTAVVDLVAVSRHYYINVPAEEGRAKSTAEVRAKRACELLATAFCVLLVLSAAQYYVFAALGALFSALLATVLAAAGIKRQSKAS